MVKSDKKTRDDQMWCPECGSFLKKGFLTCSNCRFRVKTGRDIDSRKDKNEDPGPGKKSETGDIVARDPEKPAGKNPLNRSGHPRYWNF